MANFLARGFIGLLACVIGFGSTAHAAPINRPNDTPVIVAEDKTSEADCGQWYDTPANRVPCDPGTVIFGRKTTLAR
jgi:hypothetical protein